MLYLPAGLISGNSILMDSLFNELDTWHTSDKGPPALTDGPSRFVFAAAKGSITLRLPDDEALEPAFQPTVLLPQQFTISLVVHFIGTLRDDVSELSDLINLWMLLHGYAVLVTLRPLTNLFTVNFPSSLEQMTLMGAGSLIPPSFVQGNKTSSPALRFAIVAL